MIQNVIPTLSQIAELQLIVSWLEHEINLTEQRAQVVECSNPECEYCKEYL